MRLASILFIILSIGCNLPSSSLADDNKNYFAVKAGIYFPDGNYSNAKFSNGFNGELTFGHYFSHRFAIEGGIGYFMTDISFTTFNPSLGTIVGQNDVSVVPILATAKVVYPFVNGENYIGLGIGAYYAHLDGNLNTTSFGKISIDDKDTVIGFHLMLGIIFNVTNNTFLGAEGKFIWVGDAKFEDTFSGGPIRTELDLDGITLTANFGYRF